MAFAYAVDMVVLAFHIIATLWWLGLLPIPIRVRASPTGTDIQSKTYTSSSRRSIRQ